jgi:Flp pilus assembly protein TadG
MMPLFFTVALFALDGSQLFVAKRQAQNDADAAALAAAQDRPNPAGTTALSYLQKNGYPADTGDNKCTNVSNHNDTTSTNGNTNWCYLLAAQNPGLIEVRVRRNISTFFGGVVSALSGGNFSGFDVSAHAIAIGSPITQQHCDFSTANPPVAQPWDQYLPTCLKPGIPENRGVLLPGTGNGAQGFTMARDCNAITWAGNPKGGTLGALATNGGADLQSPANEKRIKLLAFNKTGCTNPPTPPGTPCASVSWGDPLPETTQTCAKTLVDFGPLMPLNWPVTTTFPTSFKSTAFNPSTDYPSTCTDLGNTNVTFSPAATYTPPSGGGNPAASGPPGIYCITGATGSNKVLTLNGDFDSQNAPAGQGGQPDGYTFFALNGSSIQVSSNATTLKFYWPSACGTRPTGSTRPASYNCFGQVNGYDPQTMLYATNPTKDLSNCSNDAICLNGQNAQLDGDLFAIAPNTFPPPIPPPATTTGGTVSIQGGSVAAGSGFIQSWWFSVSGNSGSYTGTGPSVGDTCVFNPPVANPNQYLPTCVIPAVPSQQGTIISQTVGTKVSMQE